MLNNIKIDHNKRLNLDKVKHLKIACYKNSCPDLFQLHYSNTQRYPFLLQSTAKNTTHSRYDILFAFPQERLILDNNLELFYNNNKCANNDFLQKLDLLWREQSNTCINDYDLPFTGGWFLYLSYELLTQIEPKVSVHTTAENNNIASATRIPAVIIYDNETTHSYIVVEKDYQNLFYEIQKDFENIVDKNSNDTEKNIFQTLIINEDSEQEYINIVKKAQQYIYQGDIFQANLSREWTINNIVNITACQIYKNLRKENPAAFSGIINMDDTTIISSSPERLIKVKNNIIETRPIAGTCVRDTDNYKDKKLSDSLINNDKEKAEHIMLVDMERNDLGKVCQSGSIVVNEMMVLESLPHVHHIVSNIKGKLKQNITPGKIIKAIFPGGSITGCPKVRCMQIIHELEKKPRQSYTGSMGYLDNNGNMDLNILIRSIEKTDSTLSFRTGAGIVNDSIAEQELQETRHKAKGLLAVFK